MPNYTIRTTDVSVEYHYIEADSVEDALAKLKDNDSYGGHGQLKSRTIHSIAEGEGGKEMLEAIFRDKPKAIKPAKVKQPRKPYALGRYGMHNPMPVEIIKQIYTLATAGNLTYREIGAQFGVSKQTVENIKRGRYNYSQKVKQAA